MLRYLEQAGVETRNPTLLGLGERQAEQSAEVGLTAQVDDLLSAIDAQPTPVILVGHSYGGVIASELAGLRPDKTLALVILDGFLAKSGESLNETYPELPTIMSGLIDPERPSMINPAPASMLGLGGVAGGDELCAEMTPTPVGCNDQPARFTASEIRCPSYYLRFSRFPLFEATFERARSEGWIVEEMDLPHMATFTHPEEVTQYLLRIRNEAAS